MKNIKKIIALLLCICLVSALFAGCGSEKSAPAEEKPAEEKPSEEKPSEEKSAEEPADEHIVIGDIVIPTQEEALAEMGLTEVPETVLCTTYNATMIAYALGANIVGTVETRRPMPEELKSLPNIGVVSTGDNFDFEKIISLAGDLTLGDKYHEDKLKPTLDEQGLKSYFVGADTYEQMQTAVALLGPAFGHTEKAVELITQWQDLANTLSAETENLEHPKVLMMTNTNMFTVNSYVGSLMKILHIVNATEEMGFGEDSSAYAPSELEKILAADPDFILIQGHNPKAAEEIYQEVTTGEAYAGLKAVKEGKVIKVDSNIFGILATMDCATALQDLKDMVYGE